MRLKKPWSKVGYNKQHDFDRHGTNILLLVALKSLEELPIIKVIE